MIRIFLIVLMLITFGCAASEEKLKKQVTAISEDYVKGQIDNPAKEIAPNGKIMIGNGHKQYIIDTSLIFTGLIDDDDRPDAIATVVSYNEGSLDVIEHLIILNINKKLMIQRSVESDMKILSLRDRIITAEVPTHPRSSPLYYCRECREVVKFRYVSGELIKTD